MNKSKLVLLLCFVTLSGLARLGLDIKMNICVRDEAKNPLGNASVYVAFSALVDEEDPWKGQKDIDVNAVSDANGKCSFSGKSLKKLSVGVQKDGYYSSVQKYELNDRDSKRGRWVPYERDVEIVLRKIDNPIAMYAWSMYYEKYPVTTNEWAGFDMLMADWVPPHGEGKVEDVRFELQFNLDKLGNDIPLSVVTLHFPGKKNGVTALDDSVVSYQSHFEHPYRAPFEGYVKKEFIWEKVFDKCRFQK